MKCLGSKGNKLQADAEEIDSSVKMKLRKIWISNHQKRSRYFIPERSLKTINLLLYKMFDQIPCFILYVQKLTGENKSLCSPRTFKKKSDLSMRDGHVFLMRYCEERPLLLRNVGMGARLCTYY